MDAVMRIGQGFDVHRLVEGRRLVLGGVEIAHERGLLGHSDADVLTHAVIDALLGAAGLGDIGRHFPDTDEAWRDADSIELLHAAWSKVAAAGWSPGNVDAIVMAERPKLAPHIPAMERRLAGALGAARAQLHVKATTTEGLGFVGRAEGIAATAVALLVRLPRSVSE